MREGEESAPWNWFRSMDHWKQSSLLNSPPAHPADIKASFGMIYREARRRGPLNRWIPRNATRTDDKFYGSTGVDRLGTRALSRRGWPSARDSAESAVGGEFGRSPAVIAEWKFIVRTFVRRLCCFSIDTYRLSHVANHRSP